MKTTCSTCSFYKKTGIERPGALWIYEIGECGNSKSPTFGKKAIAGWRSCHLWAKHGKKERLFKKLEELKKKYGSIGQIILTEAPYHACNPYLPTTWECDAVIISSDELIARKGKASWDFGELENYDDIKDAEDFPWDDPHYFDGFESYEDFDLTDNDDIEYLLKQL